MVGTPEERRTGSPSAGGGEARTGRARVSGKTSLTRLSVAEAAEALGVTSAALRGRIRRNTLPHERDERGRVYVLVGASSDAPDPDHDPRRTPEDAALFEELRDEVPGPHAPSKPPEKTTAGPDEPERPAPPPRVPFRVAPQDHRKPPGHGRDPRGAPGG